MKDEKVDGLRSWTHVVVCRTCKLPIMDVGSHGHVFTSDCSLTLINMPLLLSLIPGMQLECRADLVHNMPDH